jgi:hypothetical protein
MPKYSSPLKILRITRGDREEETLIFNLRGRSRAIFTSDSRIHAVKTDLFYSKPLAF